MSYSVISIIGLTCILLFLAPFVWQITRQNDRLERKNSALQTKLKEAKKNIADTTRQAELFRVACEHAPDGIVVQDMTGKILWSNPAFHRMHGRSEEEVRGRNPLEFALPDDQTPSAAEIEEFHFSKSDMNFAELELIENRRANGELFWNQINKLIGGSDDGRKFAIQICRDVTEQVKQSNALSDISVQMEHDATHDGLTGAPNRAAFLRYFRLVVDDPTEAPVGLLHIDLDSFKSINDTHGHSAGDAVLVHTTKVLQESVRQIDMVARIGGDEFIVLCPRTPDMNFLDNVAGVLINNLSKPFEWCDHTIVCEASIGAAISGDNPVAEELLAKADFALYEAKRSGRNRATLYDRELHDRHAAQIVRSSELVDAVKSEALDYFFQPTMDLASGEILSVETLIRWDHPKEGIISPDDFLPMVKNLGLMDVLDLQTMSAALTEKKRLNELGFKGINVAFNASPELLAHPDFVDRLVWGVDEADIERSEITVEVLESTDFGNATLASSHATIISELFAAGFHVHLDDFGIGFAGLSHLATLNVTGVKIDRSLIKDLLTEVTSQKIVRKIVELSNDLGLKVVAEGVEDRMTMLALREMGCNAIQGYWLSKPMPNSALHSWLGLQGRVSSRLMA